MQRIKEKRDDGHLPPWVGFQEFGCSLSTIPYCHIFYILCIYIYIHHISILTVHLPFDTLKQYCSSLSIRTPAVDTSVTSTRGARPSAARAMDALESTSEAMTPCQPKCWENPVHQAIPLPCPVEQDDPVSSSPGEPGEKSPLFKPKVLVCSRWNNPWQNQTRLDGCLDATKSEFQIFIGLKANAPSNQLKRMCFVAQPSSVPPGYVPHARPVMVDSLSVIAKKMKPPFIILSRFQSQRKFLRSSASYLPRLTHFRKFLIALSKVWQPQSLGVGESTKLAFCTKLDRFVFKKQVHTFKSLRPGCESCTQDWKMVKTPCSRKHVPSW